MVLTRSYLIFWLDMDAHPKLAPLEQNTKKEDK